MTARSKELLLEVLLLSVKYTPAEVAWVKREISLYPDAADVVELLQTFRRKVPEKKGETQLAPDNIESVKGKVDAFTTQLLNARSTKERQRVFGVARRLSVATTPGSLSDIVDRIKSKLEDMEPASAAAVLRNYRSIGATSGADNGYVGLANYLIRKPENKS